MSAAQKDSATIDEELLEVARLIAASVDESAEQRARALGFAVSHAAGCPGIHFPGVGIVWDERLPNAQKHAYLDRLTARR